MKTTKIILSIALVALTATSFGQLSSIKDRIFSKRNTEVAYYTADYKAESSRIENWMGDLRSWASDKISRDAYEAPEVYRTIIIEQADVVYEEELGLENWMSAPFESSVAEDELFLESWMSTPFECDVCDAELGLESWMTTPFEIGLAEEALFLESWMTTPFETGLAEEPLYLESWMTTPFETDAIEMEDWMVTAWI